MAKGKKFHYLAMINAGGAPPANSMGGST